MSQESATCSELAKVGEKLMAYHNIEKDRVMEFKVKDMPKATMGSDLIENSSEMNTNDTVQEDDVEGPDTAVFGNYVLLKLIVENLDLTTLKSVRSLNSFCEEVVTPQLMNKSRIVLRSGTKSREQLEVIKNLKGITDLKINVKLSGFGFEKEGEMFMEILETLSPSLEALELEIWNVGIEAMPLPSPSIQLPALSKLTIEELYFEEEKGHHFIQLIYASAPNLTELVFGCLFPQDLSPLLSSDGSRNWALAPNLKSLRVMDTLLPEDFPHIINFPQTWESLDINVRLVDDNVYENIGRLLEKNKDSLVSLTLEQDPHIRFHLYPQTLRLPSTFPKLQRLSLTLYEQDSKVSCGWKAINYSQTFPALTSLSMNLGHTDYWDDWEEVAIPHPTRLWSSLFPPQVFEGLKDFKLIYAYVGFPQEEKITCDWAKMFPNARLEITE